MSEDESPECVKVIREVLREVECYDQQWFALIGGYSAIAQLSTLESLWRDLNSRKESEQRAAKQRNEAVAKALNAACICERYSTLEYIYDADCPVHGTCRIQKRA